MDLQTAQKLLREYRDLLINTEDVACKVANTDDAKDIAFNYDDTQKQKKILDGIITGECEIIAGEIIKHNPYLTLSLTTKRVFIDCTQNDVGRISELLNDCLDPKSQLYSQNLLLIEKMKQFVYGIEISVYDKARSMQRAYRVQNVDNERVNTHDSTHDNTIFKNRFEYRVRPVFNNAFSSHCSKKLLFKVNSRDELIEKLSVALLKIEPEIIMYLRGE